MARREIIWGFVGFVLVQAALALAIEFWFLKARDDEYASKRERLQKRIAEAPDLPLAIVLGTSRTEMGLDAGSLNRRPDRTTRTFNLSFEGGGNMLHRVCLRRLREDGICPALLIVEVVPVQMFVGDGCPVEDRWLNGSRLRADELCLIYGDSEEPVRMLSRWLLGRALPVVQHRYALHNCWSLDRLPDGTPVNSRQYHCDPYGWLPHGGLPPEKSAVAIGKVLNEYRGYFHNATLSPAKCRLLRDLLDDCRRDSIPTALILMPEGTSFRNLYLPGMDANLAALLEELQREYELPIVMDARNWVADSGFVDGHHMSIDGARVFTERFGREVLKPLEQSLERRRLATSR